jgi:hypothetical protein
MPAHQQFPSSPIHVDATVLFPQRMIPNSAICPPIHVIHLLRALIRYKRALIQIGDKAVEDFTLKSISRVIHIIRNPFDNIASRFLGNQRQHVERFNALVEARKKGQTTGAFSRFIEGELERLKEFHNYWFERRLSDSERGVSTLYVVPVPEFVCAVVCLCGVVCVCVVFVCVRLSVSLWCLCAVVSVCVQLCVVEVVHVCVCVCVWCSCWLCDYCVASA